METEHNVDDSQALLEQVNRALANATPLLIQGSNSKAFLGRAVAGEVLDTRGHRGIVSYDPTELVITARCGTPLMELAQALDKAGQMLACEPPSFGAATVGGMVASGLSGPRRPWSGSLRDFVLGTRVITGHGKHLRFGGEVMKNVAGYDLSRLMAGSYGALGVITEVSLKVLPKPRQSLNISLELDTARALLRLAEWGRQPLPISACHSSKELASLTVSPSGAARVRTTSMVCGWQSPATTMTWLLLLTLRRASVIASAAAVASSSMLALAMAMPVRSVTMVWKLTNASSRPCEISAW